MMSFSKQDYISIKELNTSLICSICFEYMKSTLMISKCSHNYCSLCIRSYCRYKLQCPMCMEPFVETDLLTNRCLDKIIGLFALIKPQLFKIFNISDLNSSNTPTAINIKNTLEKSIYNGEDDKLSTDSDECFVIKNKKKLPNKEIIPIISPKQSLQNEHYNSVGVLTEVNKSGSSVTSKVSCPVCSVEIPASNINLHLDKCLKSKNGLGNDCVVVGSNVKRKPLPKLVYVLLSEKELRKKLNDIGLPTTGDKQKLIKRHQEYVLLYNSQCDSLNPKPVTEIVKDIIKKENLKSSSITSSPAKILKIDKTASSEEMEVAKKNYIAQHKGHFSDLIAKAKNNWEKPKHNKIIIDSSDEESSLNDSKKCGFDSKFFKNNLFNDSNDLNKSIDGNLDEIINLKNLNNDRNTVYSMGNYLDDISNGDAKKIHRKDLNEDNLMPESDDTLISSETSFDCDELFLVNRDGNDLKRSSFLDEDNSDFRNTTNLLTLKCSSTKKIQLNLAGGIGTKKLKNEDKTLNDIVEKSTYNLKVPLKSYTTSSCDVPVSFLLDNSINESNPIALDSSISKYPLSNLDDILNDIENIVNISPLKSDGNIMNEEKIVDNVNLADTINNINLKNSVRSIEHNDNYLLASKYFDADKCDKSIVNSVHDYNNFSQQLDEVGLKLISGNTNLKINNISCDTSINACESEFNEPTIFKNNRKVKKYRKITNDIASQSSMNSNIHLEDIINLDSPNFDFLDDDFLFTEAVSKNDSLVLEDNVEDDEDKKAKRFRNCSGLLDSSKDGLANSEHDDVDIKLSQNTKIKISPVFDKKLSNIPRISLPPITQNDENDEQHSDDDIFTDFYQSPANYAKFKKSANKHSSKVCEKEASPRKEQPTRSSLRKRKIILDPGASKKSNPDSCNTKKLRTKK